MRTTSRPSLVNAIASIFVPPQSTPISIRSGSALRALGGQALGGDVIRDQDVHPAAEDGAADGVVLPRAARDADGALDPPELVGRHADHAPVDLRGDRVTRGV